MRTKQTHSTKSTILTTILVVLVIFALQIGYSSSWFTDGANKKIRFDLIINSVHMSVYQDDRLIDPETDYIELDELISPYYNNSLNLSLQNEEKGSSTSTYVRYKIEFYKLGVKQVDGNIEPNNILIAETLKIGEQEPSASQNGFGVKDDGYYYYQNEAGEQQPFPKITGDDPTTARVVIMTDFCINGATFTQYDLSNDIIMIKLLVETQSSPFEI